ncbi:MAG: amino acid adenylation domain-containing protein, partial [Acidobacteria bacterium]|nr:amino acid adenylation domain-containing protein [Acidobacteriota bacterium]
MIEAYAHQDLPFDRLVGELAPRRDLSQAPFFQVLLTLQEGDMAAPVLEGLRTSLEPLDSGTAKFDLSVYFRAAGEGMEAGLEYSRDLFDASTIHRFACQLETLLAQAVVDPRRSLQDLPLLRPEEVQQVVVEWNGAERAYGPQVSLHGRVEAQVDRTPDAPAVRLGEGEGELSYAQLEERANRLAHYLRARGVGPEARVGVLLERSLEMVVSLLAVLKAGGAYVPLDPDYPHERLDFMVRDARLQAVVTMEGFLDRLPEELRPEAVLADAHGRQIASAPSHRPSVTVHPENLAYMIYTSGSTGRPKGAMNSHRGIFNRLLWMQEAYGLGPQDRVLQKTPMSFDVSVWEFFWPLSTGATLVMARPGGHGDPRYLARVIQEHGITTLHFVPSMLRAFLSAPEARNSTSLRRIIASGEALPRPLVELCHSTLGAELHNLYGPTEAAVDVTAWPCRRGETGAVPIGRPIANTVVAVLDRRLRPLPVGAAGQLFLGGENLGRGYLGRGARTAGTFLPAPTELADRLGPGARLYATGDRVRWRPDGSLEFLGRIDFQVKIRGQRIELGEIEAALLELPKIRESVVVVRPGPGGDSRLVAYLGGEGPPAPQGWREELRGRLPEAMVPSHFVLLDRLPLSPNGKVDRRALPPLEEAGESAAPSSGPSSGRSLAPMAEAGRPSGIRSRIQEIWGAVLGLAQVPPDTSFFDLGGHSLLLVEVQNRLAEELGRPVELVDLFQYPTVRKLAEFLDPSAEREGVAPRKLRRRGPAPGEREVAVVAMSGRFPGAASVEELWQNLRQGVESISFFGDDEVELSSVAPLDPRDPNFVNAGGVIEGAELFDAEVFEMTPREAEILDPQQRVFLECCWEALERAGYDPRRSAHRIGLYAGMGINTYLYTHVLASPEALAASGGYAATLANDKDFLATR